MSHQNKRAGQYPELKVTFLQTPAYSQIRPAQNLKQKKKGHDPIDKILCSRLKSETQPS